MAYLLTTPEGRKELAKLRELPKEGRAIVMAFAHLMNGGTFTTIREGAPDNYASTEAMNVANQSNNEGMTNDY